MQHTVIRLAFFTLSFVALLIWTVWKRSWYMIILLVENYWVCNSYPISCTTNWTT